MAKVLFYPEKRKTKHGVLIVKNVPLLLFFSFDGNRLQYYSGERIDFKDWDFKRRLVLSSHPEHISINEHLNFLKRKVMEVYRDLKLSEQELSVAILRKKLKEVLKQGKISFFDLLILFIEEKNQEWTLSTYRKIKTFYNHLRKFQNNTGIEPDLSAIDDQFFQTLTAYFRKECNHIDSTIRKNMEVFMWFLNWAQKRGFHRNYNYRKYIDRYLTLNESIKEELFLSQEEVNAIQTLSVSGKKEMLARDVFVFACYTGLTCQELRLLSPVNIEDDWIRVTSGKRSRSVPLIPEAKMVIGKYLQTKGITLFPNLYQGKINRYLKEIARKTNLIREVAVTKYINAEEQDATIQAYRLLTLSVARKTFIHLALSLGISPLIIAQTAGYKTMNTLDRYAKNTDKFKLSEFKKFGV
jgi:site-specific recombinase XerD